MLAQTIKTAELARVVKRQIFQIVIVDSTLQDKAIAHLADSNQAAPNQAGRRDGPVSALYYNLEAPNWPCEWAVTRMPKQYKRIHASLKKLKTVVGRVWRDV